MATNFPTNKDDNTTLPNPAANNTQANPDHASQHANANDAIKALETKTGTGASVPAANTLLIGTGAGTSSWSQLTSAQLAAVLSDETGTGSAVFSNTPVLITPKIDTIQENTGGNGVTVGGVNLKSGVITGSGAGLTAGSVVNSALATGIQSSKLTNPYKFSVYRNAAANTGNGVFATTVFDTKVFDTSSNYSTSTGLFTAPVAGFYQFNAGLSTSGGTLLIASLFKNGSEYHRGTQYSVSSSASESVVGALVPLALNDTINISSFGNAANAFAVGNTFSCYFTGFLVSTT